MNGNSGHRINTKHSRFPDESLLTNCNFYNINPLLNYDLDLECDRINQGSGEIRNYSEENIRRQRYNNRIKDGLVKHQLSQLYQPCNNIAYSLSSQSLCSKYLTESKDAERILSKSYLNTQKHDYDPRVSFKEHFVRMPYKTSHDHYETLCSDKATYCHPVVDQYNQEILYKTIERNARLQRLVKELVIARQRERQINNWENYIAELRKKHGYDDETQPGTSSLAEELVSPETIENYYNTKFTWSRSHPCQHLLQDLYEDYDIKQPPTASKTPHKHHQTAENNNPYETNPFCYPTCSQGRLIVLERERKKQLAQRTYKPAIRTIYEDETIRSTKTIAKNNDSKNNNSKIDQKHKNPFMLNSRGTNTEYEDSSVQTEFYHLFHTNKDVIKKDICYEKNNDSDVRSDESVRIEVLQDKIPSNNNNLKQSSIASIEEKLDGLINSINNFIVEMKFKKCSRRYTKGHVGPSKVKEDLNHTKSDSYGIGKKERIVCGLVNDSSGSTIPTSDLNTSKFKRDNNLHKINDIFQELRKSQLIKMKDSSVGEANHPCSVQITFDIPTKEISTEVTRSLSKAEYCSGDKNVVIEEIDPSRTEDRRMAIAVNTDPVSVLALLRVSTEETIKRLLSYMPSIDYYYYLSMLPMSQPRTIESRYICNICGASFIKPSQLSDHIQSHDLGKTRDCCVCRHVLDMVRRSPGLFKCQYCGMRFTRAYCCELHQQTCAIRMGKTHDVTSSLILLR